MGKLNILVTVDSLRVGGAETMLVNLVNRLNRSDFAITVVSLSRLNPLATRINPAVAELVIIPRRFRYDLSPVQVMRRLILDRQISRVLCFDLFDYAFVRIALQGLPGPKPRVLVSVHQTEPTDLADLLRIFVYARLLANDVRIVAVCDAQAGFLSQTYRISRRKFRVIHNGVDTEYFDPTKVRESRSDIRRSLGIPPGSFVILQVANFSAVKRHEDAVLALNMFNRAHPKAKAMLVFVGGGNCRREEMVRDLANGLMLSESMCFLGIQADPRRLYKMADCFTLSSSSESLSIAALEAMAMGVPCVLPDVGGTRELLKGGVDGFAVRRKDPSSLSAGWSDVYRALRQINRERIRKHVLDNFSMGKCVGQYAVLLDQND